MQQEIDALIGNGTWQLVKIPEGAKVLPCKWVFKTKRYPDGSIERYKARLVCGGHRQVQDVDYGEVFAPVGRLPSLRALLATTAQLDWELHSLDISNAFLNGVLDVPVYMAQPEGFTNGDATMCCKLERTLYGLKQAPKEWYNVLSTGLKKVGFRPSSGDRSLWLPKDNRSSSQFIFHWVDDLLIATEDLGTMTSVKADILSLFKGRDLGPATVYLSMVIDRDRDRRTLKISQPSHIKAVLDRSGMDDARSKVVPMVPGADCGKARDDEDVLDRSYPYSELVGALMYISTFTRPDLQATVNMLARSMSKPTLRHWNLLKGVLRYLRATQSHGVVYGPSDNDELEGWTDSDFAACKDSRKSRGGFVFKLYGGAISWSSKMQECVATSTAEAEYIAGAQAAREGTWLKRLCWDLGNAKREPVPIWADNQAAIHMAVNASDSARTKHIDIVYHYFREAVQREFIRVGYVATDDNMADIFTKPLAFGKFDKFRALMGVE